VAALDAAVQPARQAFVAGAAAGGRHVLAAQPLRDMLRRTQEHLKHTAAAGQPLRDVLQRKGGSSQSMY